MFVRSVLVCLLLGVSIQLVVSQNTATDQFSNFWSWLIKPFNPAPTPAPAPTFTSTVNGAVDWVNGTIVNPFKLFVTWVNQTNENNWLIIGCRYFGSALSTYIGDGTTSSVPADVTQNQRSSWLASAKKYDEDQCLTMMVCDTGRVPNNYGVLPIRIAAFFKWYLPWANDTNAAWFNSSYRLGLLNATKTVNGTDVCHGTYGACQRDMTAYAKYTIQKLNKQSWQSPFL